MKRKNNKLLTLMLAGVLCAATAGAVAATGSVNAGADVTAQTYSLTSVFKTANSTATVAGQEGKTALTMGNGQTVEFDRDLAIKWFANGTATYTTLGFTFDDVNFTDISFTFKSAPVNAAKDDVAVNTVKFIKETTGEGDAQVTKVTVKVINGNEEEKNVTAVDTAIAAKSSVILSLSEKDNAELGCYQVNLKVGEADSVAIGEFTNVGAKYFSNTSDNEALLIKATTAGAQTVLFVDEINGQRFDNVSSDNKVTDTAAPVLVVNDDIRGFLLGAQFELDYKEIDVLDSSLTSKKTYYQYNPADESIAYADAEKKMDYATTLVPNSTTGTYFMDTVVYTNGVSYSKEAKEGFTKTTVYREKNEEYVAIRFAVEDDSFTGDNKAVYDLAWYADADFVKSWTVGETATDYIVLNRNTVGPKFSEWTETDVTDYNAKVQKNADKISAGSNAKVELPSLSWLISDENNGYQALQFTISYKTPSSSSAQTSSNLDSGALRISASTAGKYEFKVFANDVAGNAMMVEDEDGKPVEVTTSNVWDLDKIPSFTFNVAAKGIKTDDGEDTDTLDSVLLDETYTMGSIDVVGATSEKSSYALYKLNIGRYDGEGVISTDKFSGIKFAALQKELSTLVKAEIDKEGVTANTIDFKALIKQAYINLVASAIGDEPAAVAKIFVEIAEYDDRITEENETAWAASDNKYNWDADSQSFTAAESGLYLILADYWDDEMLYVDHAPAYQLVEVESEADVIKGETEWLKNNIVSVILFAIAGVMLILIIILLLVKPSDETLEDVDEKVVSKRKQATDRYKKN